jgi:hypothetical protein
MHCHAIADRFSAGSNGGTSAFYFDETETAGSKGRSGFSDGAQIRNGKPIIQGYPEYIDPLPGLDLDAING